MAKYKNKNIIIPKELREEINEKVLFSLDTDTGISKEDIFNSYTGKGGLHGLNYDDFDNYHQYSKEKKKIEEGQFFSPHNICEFTVNCIKPNNNDLIGDLTFGMGNFFNYCSNEKNLYGTELDINSYRVAKYLYPKANLENNDIRLYEPEVKFDIIFGNPPYNLQWEVDNEKYLSQLYYIVKSNKLLKTAGLLVLITPASFLADEFHDKSMIEKINNLFNFKFQFLLPDDAFKALGVNKFETKVMVFQKKSKYLKDTLYTNDFIDVEFKLSEADNIYKNLILPIKQSKEKIKRKLFLENVNKEKDQDFIYKARKYLYDIKRHPKTKDDYVKCQEYFNKYFNQEKPQDMEYDEWQKVKITKNKVLSYLKRYLKKQNKCEEDKIELVKTDYTIKLKAYSRKAKLRLNKLNLEKEISINEMVTDKKYPFSNKKYEKLISKKIADYEKQSIDLKELKKNKKIKTFLNSFSIIDPDKMKNIYFNEMQKKDLERFLQKKYSLMNWCQGTGKTFASMAWYKYILNNSNCRNIFIVAPAIAIKMTWKKTLDINKENYIQIKSLSDIEKIKKGQIVLLTFSLLASSKNYISEKIKKYIKKQSQKVALVVDESDYLCSYKTQTTKAILDCFKRVNYKLLATGTPTRNNINELYPQLELLYNNSYNMYCECYTKYRYKKGELIEEENNYYNCPFPAYRGYKLFKQCFSPGKATVFGIKKENQDIYNVDKLKKLISKTIISRSFKDIVGENKHDIITHNVKQNSYERDIYKIVIEKFYEMYHYFNRSDNTRKESMLKIIRQLQLLIKAVSIPHLFKEYEDDSVLPNKFKKIIELVNSLNDNQVAIGTTYIDAAKEYYNIFKKTDRPVYFIDGSIPFKKRKSIVNEFTKTRNGIIISTQKSLSCSVNIPTCDNIIIESLQWNIPKISQYYYRFIRLNSEKKKKVHFVTYDNTIEKNILALLLTKEKINDFVKYLEEKKRADVFKEYGIDISIFNSIIEKEIDDEGKIKLNWGKQKIS